MSGIIRRKEIMRWKSPTRALPTQPSRANILRRSAGQMGRIALIVATPILTRIKNLKGGAHSPGLYQCNQCREQFTVTVGSVMEHSKIPLNKWLMAMYFMGAGKKGTTAHQLHRMLGMTYQDRVVFCHRIREAMNEADPNAKRRPARRRRQDCRGRRNRCRRQGEEPRLLRPRAKEDGWTLVERGGRVRSKHVANISSKKLRPFIMKNVSRKSTLNTDEASYYVKMGREFAKHHAVDHSRNEYAYKLDGVTVTVMAPRTISASSSGASTASSSISEAHCTVILPSSIFATTIVQNSASRIPSVSRRSSRGPKASA